MRDRWKHGQLGEFFEIVTGGTPSKSNHSFYGDYLPLVKPPELTGGEVSRAEDNLSKQGAGAARVLPVGSVMVSCIGNLGKIGLAKVSLATNQQINSIKPDPRLAIPEFIYYQTLSPHFQEQLHKLAAGTTVPIVNKSKFSTIVVRLPPLPEQQCIVAILDEAFAGIDTAIANAEKNLANAKELFESILNKVIEESAAKADTTPLKQLCQDGDITYGVIKLGTHQEDGVPCLRTSNVRRLNIETENLKKISPELSSQYKRTVLSGGEILVSVRGTLGGVAVATNDMAGWNVSREVAVVPVSPTVVIPQYIAYCIATRRSQDWLTGVLKGVAYTGINLSDLRELAIWLPRKEAQKNAVETLDEFNAQIDELTSIYRRKLSSLAELKQSFLQKAFTGELTAKQVEKEAEAAIP